MAISKMRFNKHDNVILVKGAIFSNGVRIPRGTVVEIVHKDILFRTYDIEYDGKTYTDFSDADFEPVK